MTITDRHILRIALPSIVSNITVPLLGLVDVAIVGHLGSAAYIGAIAVGGLMFNIIYWLFAFLRMGTSGLTAQALGRRDLPETVCLLLRSLLIAGAVALALLVLQTPIRQGAFLLIRPHRRGGPMGNGLFPHLHLGSAGHAGTVRADGLVSGHAKIRASPCW